jgi:hypothetical protein
MTTPAPRQIVIIHGNGGCTAQSNWYVWLKKQLEQEGWPVVVSCAKLRFGRESDSNSFFGGFCR